MHIYAKSSLLLNRYKPGLAASGPARYLGTAPFDWPAFVTALGSYRRPISSSVPRPGSRIPPLDLRTELSSRSSSASSSSPSSSSRHPWSSLYRGGGRATHEADLWGPAPEEQEKGGEVSVDRACRGRQCLIQPWQSQLWPDHVSSSF